MFCSEEDQGKPLELLKQIQEKDRRVLKELHEAAERRELEQSTPDTATEIAQILMDKWEIGEFSHRDWIPAELEEIANAIRGVRSE